MKILFDVSCHRTYGPPSGSDVVGNKIKDHIPKLIMIDESSYIVDEVSFIAGDPAPIVQREGELSVQDLAQAVGDWHHNGAMIPALVLYIQAIERAGYKIVKG